MGRLCAASIEWYLAIIGYLPWLANCTIFFKVLAGKAVSKVLSKASLNWGLCVFVKRLSMRVAPYANGQQSHLVFEVLYR